MSGPVIRDAEAADRPALDRFMAGLQEVEAAMEPDRSPPSEMPAHVGALLARIETQHGFALIAEIGGAPAGMLIAHRDASFGTIVPEDRRACGLVSDLYVDPAHRRRGVAHALLEEAEARFVAQGLRRMTIAAVWENAAARALYARWGRPALAEYVRDIGPAAR